MTNHNQREHLHTAGELAPAMLRWLIAANAEARARRITARAVTARRARTGRAARQQQPLYS